MTSVAQDLTSEKKNKQCSHNITHCLTLKHLQHNAYQSHQSTLSFDCLICGLLDQSLEGGRVHWASNSNKYSYNCSHYKSTNNMQLQPQNHQQQPIRTTTTKATTSTTTTRTYKASVCQLLGGVDGVVRVHHLFGVVLGLLQLNLILGLQLTTVTCSLVVTVKCCQFGLSTESLPKITTITYINNNHLQSTTLTGMINNH